MLVEESPSNRDDLRRHVRIRRPASFFATASGGLGFAMPAAVGIKLAAAGASGGVPGRRRLGAVRAAGAVERGRSSGVAGDVRRRQQRALRDPRVGGAVRRYRGRAEHRAAGPGLPGAGGLLRLSAPCASASPGSCATRSTEALGRPAARADRRRRGPAPAIRLVSAPEAHERRPRIASTPSRSARTLDDLAAIGNRYAGTPGEATARDYLLERFRTVGLADVRLEAFQYLALRAGDRQPARLGRARVLEMPPAPVHGHR